MLILARVQRNEELEKQLQEQFPNVDFLYIKNQEDIVKHISEAEVFVTYGEDLTEEVLHKAEKLQWVMVMSAGIEKLPSQILKERNILVTNVRGIHKIPMAEFVFGYILQYAKQLDVFLKQQSEKVWNKKVPIQEVYGKTLLVVGAGAIGSQISTYGRTFGMHTIGINRSGNKNDAFHETYSRDYLNEVLPKADYVVSVLPNTNETQYVFTKEQFNRMKQDAVFINVGRGNAVNEEDLLEALNNDELAHAFLDVFEKEPLPEDHPFWTCEKVTLTPHLSALTNMYLPRAYEIFAQNLEVYIDKKNDFINVIDLDRGY